MPITDAEAEAVLWVLAEPIQWDGLDGKVAGKMRYQIHHARQGCRAHWFDGKGWHELFSLGTYPELFDKIAACERHHATGKWE